MEGFPKGAKKRGMPAGAEAVDREGNPREGMPENGNMS
jgi:hypothetical protein